MTTFEKYRFAARIGSGGMAEVFLAARSGPVGFQRLLVVKRLRPDLAYDASFQAMLLGEARLAARLHHPNIVQTFEVGEHEGCPVIVMEYLDGQPLHRVLAVARDRPGLLDPVAAATIVSEALAGLHHAHELRDYDGSPLRIVHRDVSPHNVFVTYEGEVKIVDFGIAKAALGDPTTDAGVVKGKVSYMSPEQIANEPLDRRTDLFAMGVVLWELLTLSRLFAGESAIDVARRLADGPAPLPSSIARGLDPELDAVCARALERRPAARFQTAADMRDALERFLSRSGGTSSRRDLVARRVGPPFEVERATMQRRIQAHMLSAPSGWGGAARSVPVLALHDARAPGPAELDEVTRPEPTVALAGALARPAAGDAPVSAPRSAPASAPRSAPVAARRSELTSDTPSGSESAPADPARRGASARLLAMLAGVAAAAFSIALVARSALRPGPVVASAAGARPAVAEVGSGATAAASLPAEAALRLCGSNTLGADLAPALVEAFLRREGASGVTRALGADPRRVTVSGTPPGSAAARSVTIESEGSSTAFSGLASGACDIGMTSRPIRREEAATLASLGFGDMLSPAAEHVVALDGIAVIVHPDNPVRSATRGVLRDVFSGRSGDWSALGAPSGSIAVYARDDASGTFDTFRHTVLGDGALLPAARRVADSVQLSDAVASDAGAIGFVGLAYVRNARALAVSERGTHPMLPSAFTVSTGEYLLSRRLFLYTSSWPENQTTQRFVSFTLSAEGQKVVRAAGFVDLGVEVADPEPCAGRCTARYAALIRGAGRLSLDFHFRPGTRSLDSRGVRDVDRLVAFLRDRPGHLVLLGFSDDTGRAADDLRSSRERAAVVASELAARGVHPSVVAGLGSEMAIAASETDEGRERNRRVEAWLRGAR